jgi:hypothetical protein
MRFKEFLLESKQVIAYHGSNQPIKKFDKKYSAQGVFWFSEDRDKILKGESGAASFKYIITATLTVNKVADWDLYEKKGLGQIEDMGFDSINLDDDWIIFDSKSIKITKVDKI